MKIDGNSLTIDQLVSVARNYTQVELTDEAKQRVQKARDYIVKKIAEGAVIYGVNTGFGVFSSVSIEPDQVRQLQVNLIRSHAVGVGTMLDSEVVRAMMLLRVNTLAKGYSGIRIETLQTLIDMLNHDILPLVPCQGSVGSSGDLAPLSHIALGLIGEGEVLFDGVKMPAADAFGLAKLNPVELVEKEGLALINGTQAMTAIGAIAAYDARNLIEHADIAAALSTDVMKGTKAHTDPDIHRIRPFAGQQRSAHMIRTCMTGSEVLESHKNCGKVQDAYSMRCTPQVHGASYDTLDYVWQVVECEMNSVTDNPLIFPDEDKVLSGGNFHGQPVALAMDFLGIAVAEIANISERRIARMTDNKLSECLPTFLVKKGGLNSGMMIPQYVAASLVSENKGRAHPASVDSVPTSAGQEDHVSMGTIAARKCADILQNTRYVLAIELMCGAQALEFHRPLKTSSLLEKVYATIRESVESLDEDRIIYYDIEAMNEMVHSQSILEAVHDQLPKFERQAAGLKQGTSQVSQSQESNPGHYYTFG